ncbi:MAG: hypothetical protein HWE10_07700, partial [Gammaproteobacteria bacterium]|nr:hypothetical protein [Gammaproteobacteria bacterium]
ERWLWQQNESGAAHKFYSPTQQQNLLSNNKQNLSFYGLQYKTQIPDHHWHLYWDGLFLLEKVSATSN